MNYELKYLKYKNKYLSLKKNMIGGLPNTCIFVNDKFFSLDEQEQTILIKCIKTLSKEERIQKGIIITTYKNLYDGFYKLLFNYVKKQTDFVNYKLDARGNINFKKSLKLSVYGCSNDDPEYRFNFSFDRFNQEQIPITEKSKKNIYNHSHPKGIYASEFIDSKINDYELQTWINHYDNFISRTKPGNCHGFLIFTLNDNDRIKHIETKEEFNEFIDKYQIMIEDNQAPVIDWYKVSQDFDAINISDCRTSIRKPTFCQYGMSDCTHTIVWNQNAIDKHFYVKLEELPFLRNFKYAEELINPNELLSPEQKEKLQYAKDEIY